MAERALLGDLVEGPKVKSRPLFRVPGVHESELGQISAKRKAFGIKRRACTRKVDNPIPVMWWG